MGIVLGEDLHAVDLLLVLHGEHLARVLGLLDHGQVAPNNLVEVHPHHRQPLGAQHHSTQTLLSHGGRSHRPAGRSERRRRFHRAGLDSMEDGRGTFSDHSEE